jgi:hypothetical protein
MSIDVDPSEFVEWMARGSVDKRGVGFVICGDVYLAARILDKGVLMFVLRGDDAWLDALAVAAGDAFQVARPPTAESMASTMLQWWPDDPSVQRTALLIARHGKGS